MDWPKIGLAKVGLHREKERWCGGGEGWRRVFRVFQGCFKGVSGVFRCVQCGVLAVGCRV